MTTPLTPEAVAQMVADREIGTEGPWTFEIDEDTQEPRLYGDGSLIAVFGNHMSMSEAAWIPEADARRATRLPDLEAAYLTLAAENATLREDTVQMLADADLDYNRKTNAMIAHHADQITSLRASEAAARERIAELEAATQLSLDTADMSNSTRSALLGALNSGAALTPTTNGETP